MKHRGGRRSSLKDIAKGDAFSEARVQAAFLRRWGHRLSVSLHKGNAAIFRACIGHHKPQVSPLTFHQVLVT